MKSFNEAIDIVTFGENYATIRKLLSFLATIPEISSLPDLKARSRELSNIDSELKAAIGHLHPLLKENTVWDNIKKNTFLHGFFNKKEGEEMIEINFESLRASLKDLVDKRIQSLSNTHQNYERSLNHNNADQNHDYPSTIRKTCTTWEKLAEKLNFFEQVDKYKTFARWAVAEITGIQPEVTYIVSPTYSAQAAQIVTPESKRKGFDEGIKAMKLLEPTLQAEVEVESTNEAATGPRV